MLTGDLRLRILEIMQQVCGEQGVEIVRGALSKDRTHMFTAGSLHRDISDVMSRIKGRSSRRIQQDFPGIRKRYWGCHFSGRGYFSATSGNITDGVRLLYPETT